MVYFDRTTHTGKWPQEDLSIAVAELTSDPAENRAPLSFLALFFPLKHSRKTKSFSDFLLASELRLLCSKTEFGSIASPKSCGIYRPQLVSDGAIHHCTDLKAQRSISEVNFLKPSTNHAMPLDLTLLRDDAPPCVHFRPRLESDGPLPLTSFLPVRAEPGELVANLSLSLNSFFDHKIQARNNDGQDSSSTSRTSSQDQAPEYRYRMFLVGAAPETSRQSSSIRATVCFAKSEHWPWFEEHAVPIGSHDANPILWRCPKRGQWFVASRIAAGGELLPVKITVAVAGGVDLSEIAACDVTKWVAMSKLHTVRPVRSLLYFVIIIGTV